MLGLCNDLGLHVSASPGKFDTVQVALRLR
jgi:hypothetical protein